MLDWPRRWIICSSTADSTCFPPSFRMSTDTRQKASIWEQSTAALTSLPPALSEEQQGAESRANEVIFQDLPLLTYTLNPDERGRSPSAQDPDLEGPLRIVEIKGFDYSPVQVRMWKRQARLGC